MNNTVEQRALWESGNPEAKNDYNDIRFAKDKFVAGKEWLLSKRPDINMEKPANLVDWICKLKYEDLNPLKQIWADKISVYQRLYDMGLEDLHIPMVGEYEKFWFKPTHKEIRTVVDIAASQPFPTIIKCNHGSGWNVKLRPSEKIDKEYIAKKLETWLHTNYAYVAGYEWQYEGIVPGLLIQPCFDDAPLDWQFYCLNGDIVALDIQRKHGKSFVENLAFVDSEGNRMPWFIGREPTIDKLNHSMKEIEQKMIPYVKEISKQFKFVRVDLFYTPSEKIKFCEATFAPCSGILDLTFRK